MLINPRWLLGHANNWRPLAPTTRDSMRQRSDLTVAQSVQTAAVFPWRRPPLHFSRTSPGRGSQHGGPLAPLAAQALCGRKWRSTHVPPAPAPAPICQAATARQSVHPAGWAMPHGGLPCPLPVAARLFPTGPGLSNGPCSFESAAAPSSLLGFAPSRCLRAHFWHCLSQSRAFTPLPGPKPRPLLTRCRDGQRCLA
jgi:hypothetical protein